MGQKKYDLGNDIFPDESTEERAYPFIHNPVVNHLKNETKIVKQNKGEPGYDDAQTEKGKDQQKVLAPLSKKITESNEKYRQEDLEAVRRKCCCPNIQDGYFGEACPNIDNTSITKYGICSPWTNSETRNECAWYFQQFCSHKKKKAYWEAIKTDLTTKLNDAEKEAIEKEINRTRYDVKQEILEKYEEYLGKHKMPIPKKQESEWVERMPFDDAATKLRKSIMNQVVMWEAQIAFLDQMDSDNNEVEELRSLVEAHKERAENVEAEFKIWKDKCTAMGLTEEDIFKREHQYFLKVCGEEQEIVEIQGRLFNKKLMAHYREIKEELENTKNALKELQNHVGSRKDVRPFPSAVRKGLNYKSKTPGPTPAFDYGCIVEKEKETTKDDTWGPSSLPNTTPKKADNESRKRHEELDKILEGLRTDTQKKIDEMKEKYGWQTYNKKMRS
jgi:hypothetical protein